MAKPCRYQLPGTDTWMSESEFKKVLNDGLIDEHINSGIISIRNFKPKAVTAPVATETSVETTATPVAETKTDGKYFIDGKEVSEEEAIKEYQNQSRQERFNLSGKKIEYQGSNEQAIRATKEHNESISPFNKDGKLKFSYIDAAIRKAFGSVSFKKFGDAYRKHIDPSFSRANNETRVGGRVGKNMSWQELASYVIGDGRELATEEQFRAFAKELGLEVPTQETTKETPAEPVAETKEVKIPKNKRERQEAADKDEMVYHDLFGTALESTPEQYEAALKEIAETGNIKDIMKYGREISERQAPRRDSFRPSLLSYNKQDAQDTLDFEKKYKEQKQQTPATTVAETKVEPVQEAKPKSLLDESTEIIDSLKDGESFTFPDGSIATKNGNSFDYQSSGKGKGKQKFSSRERMILFTNNKLSESRVGKNIELKNYETETVTGDKLKVGDVYVRDISGTRYVFKLLSKPTRDSRGNFHTAKVEVLSIGNQPVGFRSATPSSELGEVSKNEKVVGGITYDSFKSATKDSTTFGNVKKINNWESTQESKPVENKTESAQEAKPKTEPVAKEEAPKYEAKKAPKKMVAPGRTKSAFDRNFTVEISADGTTATVQGEPIETADGRTLTPPKETAKITTNINGERVAITSKGDTVYLDRAQEAEEKQVETEGKTPAEIKEEYIALAKESNGDYAIVYTRGGDAVVYKKNRRTGKWQGLTGKGEWVDVNDDMNRKANDAVNYTRKDRKMVKMSTVKNGVTSVEDFVFDFNDNTWKKLSEDGFLYGVGKELSAQAEKRFVLENPKRAPKTKEEIKQVISDIIDGAKADEGIAMSSLIPIPPKYWNKILDLVKEAVFKGVDFSFAVNDAARKIFNEAIKNKELTKAEAEQYINAINDEKNESIPELTAIKKAATSSLAQEIAEKGIDRMSYSDAFKIAEEAISKGEINPDVLVQQVIDNPRPLNAIETAVFTYSKTKLSNDLKELYDQLDSATTESQKQSIDEEIKLLSDKMLKYDIASNIVGYIQGLSLSIRRVMLNADYDLVLPQIKKLYEDAGKEMPEGLEQRIKEAQKEFRRLNREIEKLRGEAQKAKEEEAVENINESAKKSSKKKSGDSKMTMSSDGKIAVSNESIRNAVINGATEIEEVIDAVRDEVLAKFPDATDRQIRDAISNYGKEVNKTKDEIKEEIDRIKRVGRIISKLEDVQNQKGKVGKIKNPSVKTKAIKILNLRESELKRALKEAMAEIPVTDQEMKDFQQYKLDAYKKSLKDRNAELQRRIKEGDFSTNKRTRAFDLDQEARQLESERQALIEEFEYAKTKAEMESEPLLNKLNRGVLSAFNLPKGLIASIDVSAPFRQGVIFMMTQNPLKSSRQLWQMLGFWAKPKNYDKWLNELKSSEYYPLIKESGLYIAEQNGKLSAMEEVFANNLGNKIPIIGQSYKIGGVKIPGTDLYKRSEAAYSGFLNNLRVQSFMDGVELLKQNGYNITNNKEVFKDWANYVNSATGRGNMNPELALKLGPLFFSPRLIKSRLEQIGISDALSLFGLSDGFYMKMSPPVRAMALKRIGSYIGVTATMIGLAALYYNNDDDDKTSVELDPRSSDFGKIRFGNTRVDITGGFITFLRAYSQFISGQRKNLETKQIENLNEGYGKKTRLDVLKDFYSNKLSPFAKKVYDYTAISDEERERRNLEEETQETKFNELGIPVWAQDLTIPLWMRDVEPIMKEQGTGTGMFLIGISLLGEGVQYFEPRVGSSSNTVIDFDNMQDFDTFEDPLNDMNNKFGF